MTRNIQVDKQFMRKTLQTHNIKLIKLNIKNNQNVTHDHNYHRKKKTKYQWPDRQKYINHAEILINDSDGCDTQPDWCAIDVSSDEEPDDNMLLSEILTMELEKDLLHEVRSYLIML